MEKVLRGFAAVVGLFFLSIVAAMAMGVLRYAWKEPEEEEVKAAPSEPLP